MTRRLALVTLALLLVLPACSPERRASSPAEKPPAWVAPDGRDDAPGTRERPLSLAAAARAARPGDTLLLREGTYSGDVTFRTKATAENPVRIRAAKGQHPLLTGRVILAGDHVRLSGVTVELAVPPPKYHAAIDVSGERCSVDDVRVSGGSALAFQPGARGCSASRVTGEGGGAPFFSAGSSGNVVSDSTFTIEGESYLKGSENRLEGCVITGSRNGRDCYQLASNDDTSPASAGCVVRDCVFTGFNRTDGSADHTDIFQWFGSDVVDLLVEGNTFGSAYIAPGTGGADPQNAVFQISAEQTTTGPIVVRNNLVLGGHFFVSINAAMSPSRPVGGLRLVNNYVRVGSTVSTRGRPYAGCGGWIVQNNIFDGVPGIDGRCSPDRIQDHNLFLGTPVPRWEGRHSRTSSLSLRRLLSRPDLTEASSWGVEADWRPRHRIVRMGIANEYTPTTDMDGTRRTRPVAVGPLEPVR